MEFELWDEAKYRSADSDALAQRRDAIRAELVNKDSKFSTDDLDNQRKMLEDAERRIAISKEMETRSAAATAVANGAGTVISGAQAVSRNSGLKVVRSEDPFDTEDYNRAFMNYVCRNEPIPSGLVQPGVHPEYVREDAWTGTSDVPNFIPTTLMNQILEKAQGYGDLYPLLTKTNVRGGIDYNVWDFLPEAKWVTEDTPSDAQKMKDATRISFKYYMLEVKLAQSILTSVTTLDSFQAKFPEVAMESIVRALEQGYIRGDGSGKMTGLLHDTTIPAENKISLKEEDIKTWSGWTSKVKAKMKKSYRDGIFIMAQGTFDTYIDGMVDTNGQPVGRVNYGINGEEQYRFMGKRVMIVEDDIFPSFADAEDSNAFAVFTKPSDYAINSQLGMRVTKWVDEDTNLIKNKVLTIVDGKLLRPWGTLILNKEAAA